MKRAIPLILGTMLAFLAAFFDAFSFAEHMVEDTLYHNPGSVDPNIRIITIDDRTQAALGDFSGWDRAVYGELLERLCPSPDVRPAVVGFDVLFSGEKSAEGDARFAAACAEHGGVVVGFSYVFETELLEDGEGGLLVDAMAVQEKVMPYEALQAATAQGFVNALLDEADGLVRSSFLAFEEADGTVAKSFDAAVYEQYMLARGEAPNYPTQGNVLSFRYSGGVGEYENVSMIDVLEGRVPPEAFDDCIVLIGAYSAGMMDAYFVPVDRGQQMYGVEIHANVLQAILEEKTLIPFSPWLDGLIAAVLTLGLMLACRSLSVTRGLLVSLAAAGAKLGAGALLFQLGYTWNHLAAPVMALCVGVYHVILRYYNARKAKQSIERAFSKYVAPQVVKEIAKNGSFELKLGGENRDIAVLFVDIRGFTPLSESLEPEEVVDILNGYLNLTTRCIFRHGGTLDKFIGDATMAVFNAPFDMEDYAMKAILAAWDIREGGNAIEETYSARYGKQVGFGVGVACGPAVVGNIGCDFRMDYTAIGDTVNTAARLEANAPKGTIYISSVLYERLAGRIVAEAVGEIPLKGKSKSLMVYAVQEVPGYRSPEGKERDA